MPVPVKSAALYPEHMPSGEARKRWADRGTAHVPVAAEHTSVVVNQIMRLLEKSQARTHYSRSEHFTRTLLLWEAATRRAEMDEWLDLCEGLLLGLAPLAEALARLARHASS